MRQIDQEIIEATDELKHDVKLTTAIITGGKTTVVEVSPGNRVRSPKKMIEDCYAESQREIQDRFGSLEQAVGDATKSADECVTLAAECRSSESTALSSADQAIASATAGERYAGDAAQSKIAAEQSARAAAASQLTASSAATASSNAAGASVEAKNDAETAAAECLASKNTAAGSASTATEKAGIATDKATLATRQADRSKAEADRAKVAADGVLKDAVRKPHNLSDLPDKAISRKNLDVYSKAETDSRIDSKDTLPDQTGANGRFLGSDGSVASWQEVSIPPGVPVGSILPFYGRSAPMGWLGLTRGAMITQADYPALFKHLMDQQKAPVFTDISINLDSSGTVTNAESAYEGKYVTRQGSSRVIRIGWVNNNGQAQTTSIFGAAFGAGSFVCTLYQSITDIPKGSSVFLPDAANNFIKGYEPTGTRTLGTFEQDAIRNITGGVQAGYGGWVNFWRDGITGAFAPGDANNGAATGVSGYPQNTKNFSLDTSRVVPTGPENVPKNLNCLWIIKAYDAVNDPEQLQARAVIDQVNGNSSDILAINGELDRIGYALLDFGTVVKNTRYVKPNPFGNNTPVICIAEILLDGIWANPNATFEYAHGGRGVMASYVESEGVIVHTGSITLNREPYSTCSAHKTNTFFTSANCRVHAWRVKG